MKILKLISFNCFFLMAINLPAQIVKLDKNNLEAVNVSMSLEKVAGRRAVKVIKDSTMIEVDEPTFNKIKGLNFHNGTIEVKVLSRLLKDAPKFSRGFIGIAFRINDSNSKFESIYLRPTNAMAADQVRRNHSIQYFSYPDFKFDRLRKESPEKYESYAHMDVNQWIKMKIVVNGTQATLFLNDNSQPSLIVNDLKQGENLSGSIGLWVDIGTEGFFSDLKVQIDSQ